MRHIPLAGASNFRDFGGYQTSSGKQVVMGQLFRSDELSQLTAEDHQVLSDRKIKTVCDLRRPSEVSTAPTQWPGYVPSRQIHVPLFLDQAGPTTFQRIMDNPETRNNPEASRETMIELYRRLITDPNAQAALRKIFAHLADERSFPALFHCSGGKDRTGVVCALILSVLGVSQEDIVSDYMLTKVYYKGIQDLDTRISQMFAGLNAKDWTMEALVPVFSVEPAYIEATFETIENQYNGLDNYLSQIIGLSSDFTQNFHEHLLISSTLQPEEAP